MPRSFRYYRPRKESYLTGICQKCGEVSITLVRGRCQTCRDEAQITLWQ